MGPTRFGPMRLCMRAITRRSTQVVMPAMGSTKPKTMSPPNTRMASSPCTQAGIAGRHGAAVDQPLDERLERRLSAHRSISGATRSKLAMTAIRSAIMRSRLTCCVMLIAANEPVRILQR